MIFLPSSAQFVATSLSDKSFVTSAIATGSFVTVTRQNRPDARIGVLSVRDVEAAHVTSLLSEGSADFVLNVPAVGRFLGPAIRLAEENNAGWGGFADAIRALRDHDTLSDYSERELGFALRGLRRHSLELLDDHRVKILRGTQSDIVLFIGSMYQPTAEIIRSSVDRYGPFDIFAATNPNSDPTHEAIAGGESLGIPVLKWRAALAALDT